MQNLNLVCDTAENFLATLPNEFVQLAIFSPPYNIGKSYESHLNMTDYLAELATTLKEVFRVLKSTGSLCLQVGNHVDQGEVFPLDILLYPILKDVGFKLRNRIIWKFNHGLHCKKRFSGRYETILWFTKTDNYYFNLDPVRVPQKYPNKKHFRGNKAGELSCNPLGKNPSDIWIDDWNSTIWDIPNVKHNHPEKTEHPCAYPIELVDRCILALTQNQDVVLDPYVGSGSTIISALKNNRRAIGCDRDSNYIHLTEKRVQALITGELTWRELGTPIHDPKK